MQDIPVFVMSFVSPLDPELAGEGLGRVVGAGFFCLEHSGHLPSNFSFPL